MEDIYSELKELNKKLHYLIPCIVMQNYETDAEKVKILRMMGYSVTEIALYLNVSTKTISRIIKKNKSNKNG